MWLRRLSPFVLGTNAFVKFGAEQQSQPSSYLRKTLKPTGAYWGGFHILSVWLEIAALQQLALAVLISNHRISVGFS